MIYFIYLRYNSWSSFSISTHIAEH